MIRTLVIVAISVVVTITLGVIFPRLAGKMLYGIRRGVKDTYNWAYEKLPSSLDD